jgi:diguanylate cyclase (GGDEF)-like protein
MNKILIIDDDLRIHSLIKANFDPKQYEIISAENGAAGVTAATEQKPDVILLDVDMPSTQGFEICRQLKADRETRSIPVIFLTGVFTVEATIFGLECGANDYLTKPFHPSELQARIRAALRTKSEFDRSLQFNIHDELTDMFDRKYFEMRLDSELAVARRSGRPLGCILLDIDDMALVNEWFGQAIGDEVLRMVGRALLTTCRHEDVVCRFDEDEFGALISDANATVLAELAERARAAVRNVMPIYRERAVQVTASVGFALSRFSIGTSLVDEAQDALDRAKMAGGDCVRGGRELAELRLAV